VGKSMSKLGRSLCSLVSIVGLSATLALSACSQSQTQEAEASASERAAAKQAYLRCLFESAAALDDGKSDAATVGVAVRGACHRQFMDSVRLEIRGKGPDYASGYLEGAGKTEAELATTAVLRYRRASTTK
jgi:hypothetical protein